MTLDDLAKLLPLLKEYGVFSFKGLGLELHFSISPGALVSPRIQQAPLKKDELVDVDESQLPPDIRTDSINNVDAVLHWSSSPPLADQAEAPVPLTGEEPLT